MSIKYHLYNSISDLHTNLNLKGPKNPLISVIKLEDLEVQNTQHIEKLMYNFYAIFLKKKFEGKIKYGYQYYDFDKGTMTFYRPNQLISIEDYTPTQLSGWAIVFHPDFIQNYPLLGKIKDYGYFSYEVNEALHISEDEEIMISGILNNMQEEIQYPIDIFSQDVIISHLDLFLNYCNRFYTRQFITRRKVSHDILGRFEIMLSEYIDLNLSEQGQPSSKYFSERLHISESYLNDLLKNLTGHTVQQYVHNAIIEKAKNLLATTSLSTSEIAYKLGFSYSQSFNKLFKNKTDKTPQEYRKLFN